MALWTIRAEYDPESAVWWVADSDVPGLAADASTIEKLAEKAAAMLGDLLTLHADDILDPSRLAGPHRLRLLAHHDQLIDVAA